MISLSKVKALRLTDINKYFRKLMRGADERKPDFVKLLIDEYKCDYSSRQTFDDKQINFYVNRSLNKDVHNFYFSINYLIRMYFDGEYVHKNYTKAKELAESLLEFDDYGYAAINLGHIYYKSDEHKDYKKSNEFYEKAFNKKCVPCAYNLGLSYMKGIGVEKNYAKAKELFEIGISQGSQKEIIGLAYMYENGYGVEQNTDKVYELYNSVLEINYGYAKSFAALKLGAIFLNKDTLDDTKKAIELFKMSIEAHYDCIDHAANNLGNIYYNNEEFKNLEVARKYYELSYYRDTDPRNTVCGVKLGKMYRDGEGGPVDLVKAVTILSKYQYECKDDVKTIINDIVLNNDMQTLDNIVEVVPNCDFINVYGDNDKIPDIIKTKQKEMNDFISKLNDFTIEI